MYLQNKGATVEAKADPQLDAFRTQRGIPGYAFSCHTAIVEGYLIEGHVPVQAILRLLQDRPNAIGLALPGMPPDSPGMGGDEATWNNQPVALITHEGKLVPFEY